MRIVLWKNYIFMRIFFVKNYNFVRMLVQRCAQFVLHKTIGTWLAASLQTQKLFQTIRNLQTFLTRN